MMCCLLHDAFAVVFMNTRAFIFYVLRTIVNFIFSTGKSADDSFKPNEEIYFLNEINCYHNDAKCNKSPVCRTEYESHIEIHC